jgi:hypothetical protein
VDVGNHLGVGEVRPGIGVPEADATLAQKRAHRPVADHDAVFEQFSEVRLQRVSPSPY